MTQIFKPNTEKYKVLTPAGFQSYSGVSLMGYRSTIQLDFGNGKFLECTSDHKIYVNAVKAKQACRIKIGETVMTKSGPLVLQSKTKSSTKVPVYDLIGVENGARFYANSIVVSNCKPIVYEETLISSMYLSELIGVDPIEKQGQVRWYKKPTKNNMYLVALDPSLGTGGDYAAMQIVELPSFEQVGEWQHNKTPIQQQVRVMRDIIGYIHSITGSEHDIYYSVENNSLGEAALIAINEIGEENIRGVFISESGKNKKYRKGFCTTHSSKLTACAKFKQLVENNRFTLHSKNLISELKTFVASGNTYNARQGDNDDLVAAMLLVTRIMQALQNYDADIDSRMRSVEPEFDMPLPFVMS